MAAIVAKHHNGITYRQNLPVTITTSSIELQKALVEREIPHLSKMLLDYYIIERPLTAVLRKGKEHYLAVIVSMTFSRISVCIPKNTRPPLKRLSR